MDACLVHVRVTLVKSDAIVCEFEMTGLGDDKKKELIDELKKRTALKLSFAAADLAPKAARITAQLSAAGDVVAEVGFRGTVLQKLDRTAPHQTEAEVPTAAGGRDGVDAVERVGSKHGGRESA